MQKNSKNIIRATIYTTTGFPYGMAAENFIRQVALGLKFLSVPINVVRMCGLNKRNFEENDTGIKVSNMLFNRKLTGIFSILNIVILPLIIPFSLLYNKIKYGTNIVIMYCVSFAYWGAPLIFWCKVFHISIYSFETERYMRKYFGVEWYKFPKWMAYKLQYSFFDRFLNGKVCLSKYLVNMSLNSKLKPEQIKLIPHFIDTDFFVCDKIKPDSEYFTIGFSGAMYSLNGIYILIEAFKLLIKDVKCARLLLIGTSYPQEKELFDKAISSLKDKVIFPGMVPSKEVPNYLNKCDVLVNPREKSVLSDSGFPTKIGEYLSTGKVVVTSNTGDLDYYFKNELDLFFFESGDIKSLADCLKFIYYNKDVTSKVGRNGQVSAKSHLSYIESTKKLIELILKNN